MGRKPGQVMETRQYKRWLKRVKNAPDRESQLAAISDWFDAGGDAAESVGDDTVFGLLLEVADQPLIDRAIETLDLSDGFRSQLAIGEAIHAKNSDVLRRLLERGAAPNPPEGYLSPLAVATDDNADECADVLLEHGASFDDSLSTFSTDDDATLVHVMGLGAAWPERRCACCGSAGPARYVTIEATSKASGPTGGAVYSSTITHTAQAKVPVCGACFEHQRDYHRADDWGSVVYALAVIGVFLLDLWVMMGERRVLANLLEMSAKDVWMVVHPSALVLLILLVTLIARWKSSRLDKAQQNRSESCVCLSRPVEYQSLLVPVYGDTGDTSHAEHVFRFASADYAQDFIHANPGAERILHFKFE